MQTAVTTQYTLSTDTDNGMFTMETHTLGICTLDIWHKAHKTHSTH